MTMRFGFRATIATGLLVAATLGGCSKSSSDASQDEDTPKIETTAPEPVSPPPAPVAAETPAPEPKPDVAEIPREEPIAPDVQTQDDADATGMTAHVSRGEEPENGATQQP